MLIGFIPYLGEYPAACCDWVIDLCLFIMCNNIRIKKEQCASFDLGFSFDDYDGLHPEYYCLGEEFSERIAELDMISFRKFSVNSDLIRFVKGFSSLKSFRNKYADCLPCESLSFIDYNISYFQAIANTEKVLK